MLIARIEGATRVLGKSQGYLGLPVRDESVEGVPCMVTAWEPSPDEIARLVVGAPVYLRVLGSSHPPVAMEVGTVPTVD